MPTELRTDWTFEAIGTHWQIGIYQQIEPCHLEHARSAVDLRIKAYDATYSRFKKDSLVSAIAQSKGTFDFPEDSDQLFTLYSTLYDLTDGLVTPLIGQALSDAGYDADYSLRPKPLTNPPSWPSVMDFHERQLVTQQPVLLDFGAAGKGYLVDIITQLLLDANIQQFFINAGGDIRAHGLSEALRVGLEHPSDPEQVIGVVELGDSALCGSAGNRRAWANYTHILNPNSLTSPTAITATWCLAENALIADGLATALYFVEPKQLEPSFAFDYCIAYADNTLRYSETFKTALFQPGENKT